MLTATRGSACLAIGPKWFRLRANQGNSEPARSSRIRCPAAKVWKTGVSSIEYRVDGGSVQTLPGNGKSDFVSLARAAGYAALAAEKAMKCSWPPQPCQ